MFESKKMSSSNALLPATTNEFVDQKYWESFYAQRGAKTFDWLGLRFLLHLLKLFSFKLIHKILLVNLFGLFRYGTWDTLGQSLDAYLRPADKILQIGCGSSPLADEMHDNGYRYGCLFESLRFLSCRHYVYLLD